jgi:hypothetical protein
MRDRRQMGDLILMGKCLYFQRKFIEIVDSCPFAGGALKLSAAGTDQKRRNSLLSRPWPSKQKR